MANALASKASVRKDLGVRVPPAPLAALLDPVEGAFRRRELADDVWPDAHALAGCWAISCSPGSRFAGRDHSRPPLRRTGMAMDLLTP